MEKSLYDICQEHGMTLTELGRRIGKSKQYMSELARGNVRLKYDMAIKIAEVFGTTPDKLFLPSQSNETGQPTGTEGR